MNLKDIDTIASSFIYKNKTSGDPIDITNYRFDAYLKQDQRNITTYSIAAGDVNSEFLTKTGDDANELNMQTMFADVQQKCLGGGQFRLILKVTQPDFRVYVHATFEINAGRY